jgi:hypothetical protein
MTRTNMKLSEICKLWRADKRLYLETEESGKPRRVRIIGLYVKAGYQLQVKVKRGGQWRRVEPEQVVYAA